MLILYWLFKSGTSRYEQSVDTSSQRSVGRVGLQPESAVRADHPAGTGARQFDCVGRWGRRPLTDEQLCSPHEYLKRTCDVYDLRIRSSKENNALGAETTWCLATHKRMLTRLKQWQQCQRPDRFCQSAARRVLNTPDRTGYRRITSDNPEVISDRRYHGFADRRFICGGRAQRFRGPLGRQFVHWDKLG